MTVINLPTLQNRSYGETLAMAFVELATYWRANLPMTSTSTDAEQVELSLPSSAQTRLAFYAVPTKEAAIYKEYLYPLAERYGFTPIMAVDVLSPGDNVMAKVEALIGRSAIVIADIGTQNTTNEAMMALFSTVARGSAHCHRPIRWGRANRTTPALSRTHSYGEVHT